MLELTQHLIGQLLVLSHVLTSVTHFTLSDSSFHSLDTSRSTLEVVNTSAIIASSSFSAKITNINSGGAMMLIVSIAESLFVGNKQQPCMLTMYIGGGIHTSDYCTVSITSYLYYSQ